MRDLTKTMEITMKDLDIDDDGETAAATEKDGVAASGPSGPSGPPPPYHPSASVVPDDAYLKTPGSETPKTTPPLDDTNLKTPKTTPPYTEKPISTPPRSGASTPSGSKLRVPARPMLTEKSDEDTRMAAEGMTQEERELRKKEKRKGLSKEQKEELAQYELERRKVREERVSTLAQKLVDRICVWTETDKGPDVTHAFNEKTKVR